MLRKQARDEQQDSVLDRMLVLLLSFVGAGWPASLPPE